MDGIAEDPQETVLQRILRIRQAAKAAEQKVCRNLVSDYPMAGLVPVVQLAAQAEVSTATVLRVVSKLGFPGYAAFQSALRMEVSARLFSPANVDVEASTHLQPLDQNRLALVQNTFINALRSTFARIDEGDLDRIVSLLADLARPVFIIGGKFSSVLATHLGNYLTIMRPSVRVLGAGAVDGSFAMLDVNRRAVFVVFDYRRYQRTLLQWISSAKETGATIALLTDQHLSPVASLADHVFVCDANALGRFDSLVSGHILVDLLIHLVFDKIGLSAQRRLEAFEDFRRFDE